MGIPKRTIYDWLNDKENILSLPKNFDHKFRSFFIRHCYGGNLNVLGLTLKLYQNSFRTNRRV